MKDNILSQEEIINIQNSVDIVDIISGYIPLTNRGKNFFGVCPFHADHSPSMSVSKEKQIYKCFSCGASGNVFNFIMNYENVSFYEALKIVANKSGIVLNLKNYKATKDDKLKILYDIFDLSKKFYKNNINTENGKEAIEFIKNRKFDLSIIKDFELGLSLKENDALTKLLIKKKYSQNDMIRTGLVLKDSKGLRDVYINRIMFPIYNLNGQLVGYSGRVYNSESKSKYVNTKETELFKKSDILYNYHRAKEAIKKNNQIIIVEGFFATIRLHTIGVDNVVATLGTAFTKKHALNIKKLTSEVILCFDGDSAGFKATNSCINELIKVGITPKIIQLEDGLDPDDYVIKYGKNKMLDKINNPINVMDFKLNYHKLNKNLNSNEDLSLYINEIIDELKKINDDIYVELTLKKLSDISNISIDILRNKIKGTEKIKVSTQKQVNNKKLNKFELAERNLIYYMLNNKNIVLKFKSEKLKFSNSKYEIVSEKLNEYLKKFDKIDISSILTYYRDSEIIDDINTILSYNIKENYNDEEIEDYIKVMKEYEINKKISTIKNNINGANDNSEKTKLLEEILNLKKKKLEGENNYD